MQPSSSRTIRQFSDYERVHLLRHGLNPAAISADDTTPVEYLTGRVDFDGWEVQVTPAVLIPRVETETLVELAWQKMTHQPGETIAEVGTGSGAIGVSLYRRALTKNIPFTLMLSDVSDSALAVAHMNLDQFLSGTSTIPAPTLLKSDLLEKYEPGSLDGIIANLPYIPTHRLENLDPSVKNFEPRLALDGGPDGLHLILTLLHQSLTKLKPDGWILLEVDDTHTLDLFEKALFQEQLSPHYSTPKVHRDQFQKPRFIELRLQS